MRGIVFNIQHYSLHDGPGIRTIVFLKGCPLRCPWCSNPESQEFYPQFYLDDSKCIHKKGCNLCEQVCEERAVQQGSLNHSLCNGCGKCLEICPSKALNVYGKDMSAEEILDIVEQENMFYSHGNGGITLSGGEPFAQGEFTVELLKEAKRRYIHTAVETCGYGKTETLGEAAQYLDYIMYDIKCMDSDRHRQFTGRDNRLILDNLEMLFCHFPSLHKHIRTPVIPGFNDREEDIRAVAEFLDGRDNYTYELLPYHRFGQRKYELLGRSYTGASEKLDEQLLAGLKHYCVKRNEVSYELDL